MQRKTFGTKSGGSTPRSFGASLPSSAPAAAAQTASSAASPLPSYASLLGEAGGSAAGEAAAATTSKSYGSVTDQDMILALGKDWGRFRRVWYNLRDGGLGLSWSWWAFFLPRLLVALSSAICLGGAFFHYHGRYRNL